MKRNAQRDTAAVAILLLDTLKYIEAEFDVDVLRKVDQDALKAVTEFVEDIEGR